MWHRICYSQHMSVMLLSLCNVLAKFNRLWKWRHDMQDNKTQQNGNQHNNKEWKTAYATASIWVSSFHCCAIFHPSLWGFDNGATTCRILKLNRMSLSITIENVKHYTLQPAYECHALLWCYVSSKSKRLQKWHQKMEDNKVNRTVLSITITNVTQHKLQPAYECHVFMVMLCFGQVYEALKMALWHAD